MRAFVVVLLVSFAIGAAPASAAKSHAKPHADSAAVAPVHHAPRPPAVDAPEILFTFDDGPAVGRTPRVLDLLDQHHIKAVFFVNGWHFQGTGRAQEAAREILREEVKRGHAVGNHTIHHYFLCGKVYSKRAPEEIEGNAALIEQAIGMRPQLFRTPYGSHCKPLNELLASLGIKPIGWDIDPQDWKVRNAAKIELYIENQLQHLHGRAIVLFHDIQSETVKALPNILDWLDHENNVRASEKRPPIKILDYTYLLPPRELVPPTLDALGRVLIACLRRADESVVRFWPRLAWLLGQV